MALHHDSDSLVPVSALPKPFQGIFKYRYFNSVQSESFSSAYLSDDNMVVSAPTGSGKTGIFELCILRLLTKCLTGSPNDPQFNHPRGAIKIVYVAPTKALIQEKMKEWENKFGSKTVGLICQELTGDSDTIPVDKLPETDLILTTPEKFDSTTRRCREHGSAGFLGDIALLLIDEVHLLHDTRGACLEAIVSRIKMLARFPSLEGSCISRIRLVAVSATIPNIEDLAEWLLVPERAIRRFGEEMRPVKLTTNVYGYAPAKNDYLFEKRLQYFIFDVICQHSGGKPTLVFCPTRKSAQDTAVKLAETVTKPDFINPYIKSRDQQDRLQLAASQTNDKNMQFCIQRGVGFHNGGLEFADRGLVEGLFLQGDLQVLSTTMTLAHGMNLPAHLVVIKSTQYYNKDRRMYMEYERSTLLQMCGRAGRPQFDDSGVVVLMTQKETMHLYQNLFSGSEPVESEFLPSIAEHLNAEIVLMTVSDVSRAMDWLKCSYLYIRIRKNPHHYKVEISLPEGQLDKYLKELCLRNVHELANYGMVETPDEDGFILNCLEPGKLMAKYYLKFETMKAITRIHERSSTEGLLHSLATAQELSGIQLRRYEKRELNAINQDPSSRIKFHVLGPNGKTKKRIQTSSEKIFVLVNDALSGEASISDFTMTQDITMICTHGPRILRCMSDYFMFLKRYSETKTALLLTKCLRQRLWEDSPYLLKQLPGIGLVTAKAFRAAGIYNFEMLASSDPRHLEFITGRKFPYGDQVKSTLNLLPPKCEMKVHNSKLQIGGKYEFVIELTRQAPWCEASSSSNDTNKRHVADLIVGDEENHLICHERIRFDKFTSPYRVVVYSKSELRAALIYEQYVGMDVIVEPPTTTALKKCKLSVMPPKPQQQKKKLKLSDEQESSVETPALQTRRYQMDTIDSTLSEEMSTTSYFNNDTLPLQAHRTVQNHDSGPGMIQVEGSYLVPVSPPGQDLKSLRSFLQDQSMQQSMSSDEEITSFIDSILVDSPPYNLQTHKWEGRQASPYSAAKPTSDHEVPRKLLRSLEYKPEEFEKNLEYELFDKVCQGRKSFQRPSDVKPTTECTGVSDYAPASAKALPTGVGSSKILLPAESSLTQLEELECPVPQPYDTTASKRSAYPQFSLSLSQAAEDHSIFRCWSVPDAPSSTCEDDFGTECGTALTQKEFNSGRSDGSEHLPPTMGSNIGGSEMRTHCLGSKSLFSFLYE